MLAGADACDFADIRAVNKIAAIRGLSHASCTKPRVLRQFKRCLLVLAVIQHLLGTSRAVTYDATDIAVDNHSHFSFFNSLNRSRNNFFWVQKSAYSRVTGSGSRPSFRFVHSW